MTKKNKKGFTLTELIVVIVIIGILAAVLIPSLTGYIDKSRDAAAEQEATAIVTAHQTWMAEKDELQDASKTDFAQYCVNLKIIEQKNDVLQIGTPGSYESWEVGFVYTASNNRKVTYKAATEPHITVVK